MQEKQIVTANNGVEIVLRPAVSEDAREIIDTVSSVSPERSYVLMEKYGKDEETERKYITDMDRQHNLLLVAVAEGVIVGSLAALQENEGQDPKTTHILNVGLHLTKAYRGLGIGSKMLQYAIDWARERGFRKLEANIFTVNSRSLKLFSNAGFVEEGTRRKQYRIGREFIDEVIVAKFLD
ncbi:MAG: GNAT family N-acetyltransferase [Clostridia bacterium]|nr:GNAT family N-acetyltransferase [Clostridia bacterium]